MAATFADTLLTSAGAAVPNADVIVRPLEAGAVAMAPSWALTGAGGAFSLSIPSGTKCRLTVPAARIDHVVTPSSGATITLEDAANGTPFHSGVAA